MPKFVSIETGNIYGASRPANTPRQACSLDCIAKLRFAFQPASLVDRHLKKDAAASTPRQAFFTEHYAFRSFITSFPATAGNSLSPHIFSYQHTQPHASSQPPFRLDRPARFHSHFFFLFLPFFSIQKRKPAKPISISFSCNPKSSPNLVQASLSQSLSLLFSPSTQYTLPHRPRSAHT